MMGARKVSSTPANSRTGQWKGTPKSGRVILHGASGRAYNFKAYAAADLLRQADVKAVYVYARSVPVDGSPPSGRDATAQDYEVGYIGKTGDMAADAALHAERQDFRGHAFNVALLVPVEQANIREEIWRDLVDLHRPVLNELLHGGNGGKSG